MRKITQASMNDPEEWKPPTLKITRKAAIYARRSDERAKRKETDTSQSREMQTEDLLIWAIGVGWEQELLEPYFADLGLSGTLRPDERPDMLRLFDDIDVGTYDHGTVICYQESRLFRDETQIYYNQFIQKCKAHDVLVVAASPYTMIYDFADEFLTEMFRWKCKEAGEFIKRQIKGWMLPARFRAAKQGCWSGLGDVSIGYVEDIDPKSPTYKRFIVYKPHAIIVVYVFIRFAELAGDLSKLMRELAENPIVFPPIPDELKHSVYLKNRMMSISGGMLRIRTALESILTNRHYLGWRVVAGEVVNKNSHPAIVDVELFEFAFTTLTGRDLDGNVLELLEKRGKYYQRCNNVRKSLLKDRIQGSEGKILGKHVGKNQYNYSYVPDSWKDQTGFTNRGHIEIIDVETLDAVLVERLFFHIKKITNLAEYNTALEAKRVEKQRAIEQVKTSLATIPVEQERLIAQLAKTESETVQRLLLTEVEKLEQEKKRLSTALPALQKEHDEVLHSLDIELLHLEQDWQEYPLEKRIALLNFLIYAVEVDLVSPRWLRVRVAWLPEEWGCEQMYLCRPYIGGKAWTKEEEDFLKEHFPTAKREVILNGVPNRTWQTIRRQAYKWRMKRQIYEVNLEKPQNSYFCMNDLRFMEREGITLTERNTNWTTVYQ
jgi:Resolvase, N terminal domain